MILRLIMSAKSIEEFLLLANTGFDKLVYIHWHRKISSASQRIWGPSCHSKGRKLSITKESELLEKSKEGCVL